MTRTMYDSVTAGDIPLSAQLVAGYVDGIYAWSAADWHRFSGAVTIGITITAVANAGVVLDVERGDALPQQAPGWVLMRRATGVDPSVYMNASTWPAVRRAFAAQGVREPHYWVAAYDGHPTIPAGAVAHQYADPLTSGGHFDLSSVVDYWPGVDPVPTPLPEASDVKVLLRRQSDGAIFVVLSSALVYVPDVADLNNYTSGGFVIVNVTDAEIQEYRNVGVMVKGPGS